MQNPNDLALNMTVFLPLAAFMALRPGSMIKRIVAAGCAGMVGAIVVSWLARRLSNTTGPAARDM